MNSVNVGRLIYKAWESAFTDTSLYILFLPMLCLMVSSSKISAQQATDYTVHANIIYRFTKYIDWPESKKSGVFIIGVVGESALIPLMENFIANKTVRGQPIMVKKFSAASATFNCHILFISEEESGSFKKIVSRTAGNAILLVTESEGLASKGSCINFIIVDERLKLEINKINIDRRNMGIASELLQLGSAVK